jgi:hypothetical protein
MSRPKHFGAEVCLFLDSFAAALYLDHMTYLEMMKNYLNENCADFCKVLDLSEKIYVNKLPARVVNGIEKMSACGAEVRPVSSVFLYTDSTNRLFWINDMQVKAVLVPAVEGEFPIAAILGEESGDESKFIMCHVKPEDELFDFIKSLAVTAHMYKVLNSEDKNLN